ncbi:MAG: hypothetical protein EBT50_08830 [Verrucomicrobia bacterium]|nr:hypothetical protein [Verrucomicrobiota bacterium]
MPTRFILVLIFISLVPALRAEDDPVIDLGGFKRLARENDSLDVRPKPAPRLETIQQSIDRQNQALEKYAAQSQRLSEERFEEIRERQKTEDNDWQAGRWRDVETVAGAFVADGPYYKGGNKAVITDKGLVYSTGRGSVVAPDGYYYRSGNLWVGPDGKLFGQSGSGNNRFIWGSDGETAISAGRGFFTSNGYSWPAYQDQAYRGVSTTMRRP